MTGKRKGNQSKAKILTSVGVQEVDLDTRARPDFIIGLQEGETEKGGLLTVMEVIECPKCHVVDAEIEEKSDYPTTQHYRCSICGEFYLRNVATGEINF